MRKGNTANARECALSVLVACRRNGAWADAALKAQLGKCALSAQDAALCSEAWDEEPEGTAAVLA